MSSKKILALPLIAAALLSALPEIEKVEIATGDKTVVMIDGKSATPNDLKPGQYMEVAFVGGHVRRIVVQLGDSK